MLRSLFATAVFAILAAPSNAQICPGDCNGDRNVAVAEIVEVVNILLDLAPLQACPGADPDEDGTVAVNEAVLAVNASFDGCPSLCGNGVLDPGEECDVGLPESTECYADCTICCAGDLDCFVDRFRCCQPDADSGLVVFDPDCRNCGQLREGCGGTSNYGIECCDDLGLRCAELRDDNFPFISGTCCPKAGSPCVADSDCCGGGTFPASFPVDLCMGGRCCVQTGGVCHDGSVDQSNPCCHPDDRCLDVAIPQLTGWRVCVSPSTRR